MYLEKRNMIELLYPVGTRVRLIKMDDIQAPRPGTEGIVKYIDDMGQIHVNWENGGSLALIVNVDRFEVV